MTHTSSLRSLASNLGISLGLALALTQPGLAATKPAAKAKAPSAQEQQLDASARRILALADKVDVPYSAYTLSNGLRVIVNTDRKAPVVAVQVVYHVGSKDEPEGKTGFAHLFEHLMFQGSQHVSNPDELLDEAGVTDNNGTTNNDRTNYYDTVPTAALDRLLFIQSDRMGFLVQGLTQKMLDEQRGVVQNEKRQRSNVPYGKVFERIVASLFPAGHGYQHTVIGSMEDLDAASLDDVKKWFQQWYGPNNAVLVISGDIDGPTARAKAEQYFGAIPPSAPIARIKSDVPSLPHTIRDTMQDRVANTRIYKIWPAPPGNSKDVDQLGIGLRILGQNSTSRLDQALVRGRQLALSVSADIWTLENASAIFVTMDVRPGVDPAVAEAALDAELAKYLANGPTSEEVRRVATSSISGTINGLESITGKADLLADCTIMTGNPGCWKESLRTVATATPAAVRATMATWMQKPSYILTVTPFGNPSATGADVDRNKVPDVGQVAGPSFPVPERATLSNGIKVIFAKNSSLPTVNIAMSFDAGLVVDDRTKPGLALLTFNTAKEGTKNRSLEQIERESDLLGAGYSSSNDMDHSYFYMNTLAPNLDPAVALWSDLIRNPAFPKKEFERLRKTQRAALDQELNQIGALAMRVWPTLLFGKDHGYAMSMTGNGSYAGLDAISYEDLPKFYNSWIRPDNATIFAVGDSSLAELMPVLEKYFGNWQATGDKPIKIVSQLAPTKPSKIYIIDKPESTQSYILASAALPLRGKDDLLTLTTANEALGSFLGRINMNLRERKGWSYGAYSGFNGLEQQVPFMIRTSVQTDKTAPAMLEILNEMRDFLGPKGLTLAEEQRILNSAVRSLAGAFDNNGAVLGSLINNYELGRPDDYQVKLVSRYKAMNADKMNSEMRRYLNADQLLWVIVGDRAKIEAAIRATNIAPVEVVEVKN